MKLYEFNKQDAYDFANFIHAQTRQKGDELSFRHCPYCNGKGRENEYTFSINLKEGTHHCLRASCGAKGNMITLAKDFDFSLGNFFDEYYQPKKEYRNFGKLKTQIVPKDPVKKYFNSRGISNATIEKYKIGQKNNADNIITFPFLNENGEIEFIKYRKTDYDKEKDKGFKEWCEADCKTILFGMYQCNLENKTLILTEGQIDSLSVAEVGYENAVSVPTGANGFTWIPHCWDWLHNFDTLIVFGDYEKGKMSLLEEMSKRFQGCVKYVKFENYEDCKDANEILQKYGKEQIKKCIDEAVAIPTNHIKDLSQVESVKISDIQKLPTTIRQLDKVLKGGFPFGGVTLIAGKAGEGKSTFASQVLANAIAQGHKVFAYSGELPNFIFRNWLDFQIAGKNRIAMIRNAYGEDEPMLSEINQRMIAEWYKDKAFIYDNNTTDEKDDDGLVKIMQQAIVRNGVDVLLIDNLMTALDLDIELGNDRFERQSRFVKKVTRLALEYKVLILLVAHQRKNVANDTNQNDAIMGSSDISNLAMVTITYSKPTIYEIQKGEATEEQRILSISKNRLFGKVNTKGWVLDFEPNSKRIYGIDDDPNFDLGWDATIDRTPFDTVEKTPFD